MTAETGQDGIPLRRRVLTVIIAVTVLAVALFAIPLALSVRQLYRDETVTALERDAAWIAAVLPDDVALNPRTPFALPPTVSADLTVGVYTVDGRRLLGAGPAASALARRSRDGHVREAVEDDFLAVSAPIPSDGRMAAVVRVATPYDRVEDQVHRTWLLMAALAAVVLLLAIVLAVRQAARLAAPLEELTAAAQALGGGDFSIRAPRSGVREADAAGEALEATANRLGRLLERERAFSADVSHQLRTGLTGLMLGLESALARPTGDLAPTIRTAIDRGEHLRTVIEDLLRLARDSRTGDEPLDVPTLLEEIRRDWHGPLAAAGRRLTVTVDPGLPQVSARPSAVRQILHVLLDNATTHGGGEVTVEATDLGTGMAIEVGDQGRGVADEEKAFTRRRSAGDGHGIGLALARSLAEAEGGRLVLRRGSPPLFSLLLPES
ncbi:signal transduction histidine kinase [Streptosporangium album]|uniref:histidine kinase n=1 Tax=Streptosporangium album TaxID=47479 RepID=A0A7W7WDU7_9ACTN|nr:HAMP domain-containing sensor histidine kinase [Streptosporangium album]MBB4943228.1 signal transduction histidine kinase [Streptosporangium album]